MHSKTDRPTCVRYAILGALCSLAFLTYLDRICIMRVQDDIANELGFKQLTPEDEDRLRTAAARDYRPDGADVVLTKDDEARLVQEGKQDDYEARRLATENRLRENRATLRLKWVFSAFLLGYVLFEIPGGWLGDKWGPRLVIAKIVICWSALTALTGSVDKVVGWFLSNPGPTILLTALVLVRFLFGLGEAGAYPNFNRALARWFPYRERALAVGAIWMASRFGGAFSPMIAGGLILLLGGWRQVFWALGTLGVVWALVFFRWYRDRPEDKAGVNEAEAQLIRGPGHTSSGDDESHALRGAPWRRMLFSTNLWAVYLAAAAVSFSWYVNVTFLPKYLKEVFQVDYRDSEIMTGLPLFVSAFFCLAGGALSDFLVRRTGSRRWGRSLPGVIGFGMAGVCDLLIPHVHSAWAAIGLICMACAVQDLAIPCLWAACADIGGRYAGTLSGIMNAVGGIGGILSPLLSGDVAVAYGWNTVFLIFAATYFLGSLLWLRIDATQRLEQPTHLEHKGQVS